MTLGMVLMLNDTRASFTLPSLVTSTCTLSCALIAPQLSRLADRYGQTRVAIPAIGFARTRIFTHSEKGDKSIPTAAIARSFHRVIYISSRQSTRN